MKRQSFLIFLVALVFSQVSLSISSESTEEDTCNSSEKVETVCDDDGDECITFEVEEIRACDVNHEKEKWVKPQNSDDLIETSEKPGKKNDEDILKTARNEPKKSFAPKKVTPTEEVAKRHPSNEQFKLLPKKMEVDLNNFESNVEMLEEEFISEESEDEDDDDDDDEDDDDEEDDNGKVKNAEKENILVDNFRKMHKSQLEILESDQKMQEEIYKAQNELEELEKRRKEFDELKKTLKEIEDLVNELKFIETDKKVWKPNLKMEL